MALILCHHCLAWIEPIGQQCPECDYPVDTGLSDPPLAELETVIGQLVRCLGNVRVSRAALPEEGMLYETTNGLFFVPHCLERVRMVADHQAESPRMREASGWRNPLLFLRGLLRSRRGPRIAVSVQQHAPLRSTDSRQLPLLLMQDPGVFFVARRSIHSIRWTLRGWLIARPNSPGVWFRPLGDRSAFSVQMAGLAAGIKQAACP